MASSRTRSVILTETEAVFSQIWAEFWGILDRVAESKSRDADAKAKSVKAQLDSYARTAPRNSV